MYRWHISLIPFVPDGIDISFSTRVYMDCIWVVWVHYRIEMLHISYTEVHSEKIFINPIKDLFRNPAYCLISEPASRIVQHSVGIGFLLQLYNFQVTTYPSSAVSIQCRRSLHIHITCIKFLV